MFRNRLKFSSLRLLYITHDSSLKTFQCQNFAFSYLRGILYFMLSNYLKTYNIYPRYIQFPRYNEVLVKFALNFLRPRHYEFYFT